MSLPQKETKMFTLDNTDGFTQADLDLMNAALEILVADGVDPSNASDIINNNWQSDGNTVETLTAR
jgi:hypothetical protein